MCSDPDVHSRGPKTSSLQKNAAEDTNITSGRSHSVKKIKKNKSQFQTEINWNAAAFKQTGLHILSPTERCYENQHWFGTQVSENWCVTIATVSCRWAFPVLVSDEDKLSEPSCAVHAWTFFILPSPRLHSRHLLTSYNPPRLLVT